MKPPQQQAEELARKCAEEQASRYFYRGSPEWNQEVEILQSNFERICSLVQLFECVEALKCAINTVECDSLDAFGNELPWYKISKRALSNLDAALDKPSTP